MRSLLVIGYKKATYVFLIVGLLTLYLGGKAGQIRVDGTPDGLMRQSGEEFEAYQNIRDKFGSDEVVAIYVQDEELSNPWKLAALKNLNTSLQKLPYVQRVDSLFTLPDISEEDGWVDFSPILSEVPKDENKALAKLLEAANNPVLNRHVISSNGKALLLLAALQTEKEIGYDDTSICYEVEQLLSSYTEIFENIYQVGGPALHVSMVEMVQEDREVMLLLASAVVFILLVLNLKSFAAGFLPLLNTAIAVTWTLGMMVLCDVPLNMLNYILPVLVLIIGATEDVHVIHEFRHQLAKGKSRLEAMTLASDRVTLALVLTGLTTVCGFVATGLSGLPILKDFGITTGLGMFARFLISVFLLPAFLRWLVQVSSKEGEVDQSLLSGLLNPFVSLIMNKIVPRPRFAIVFVGFLVCIAVVFAFKIRMSNDLVSFLGEQSETVQKLDQVAENMSGTKMLMLVLHADKGDFRKPQKLERLEAITESIRNKPEVDSVLSFSDLLGRVHSKLNRNPELVKEGSKLPIKSSTIEQYLLFFNPGDLKPYISEDFSEANIKIRCHLNDSEQLNIFARELEKELSEGSFGVLHYTLTGKALLLAKSVDEVITTQITSLVVMILLVFLVCSGLFLSIRCGILSIVCNLIPIVLVFGLMGMLDVSLNIGTCMVAAVTLGIAIDDTLHLLVRFNGKLKELKNERLAVEAALREEFIPVVSTSIALAGGFAVLASSSFLPVRQFGMMSAVVMVLAILIDLVFTPVLFGSVRLVTLWDLLGLKLRKALLLNSPFFEGLTLWQAKKLILASDVEEYHQGDVVMREGEVGDKMYVVLSGQLDVFKSAGQAEIYLATLKMGDVFGETAVVTKSPRSASIRAIEATKLLMLDQEALGGLRRFSPFLASRIFLNLAAILGKRLAETSSRLGQVKG